MREHKRHVHMIGSRQHSPPPPTESFREMGVWLTQLTHLLASTVKQLRNDRPPIRSLPGHFKISFPYKTNFQKIFQTFKRSFHQSFQSGFSDKTFFERSDRLKDRLRLKNLALLHLINFSWTQEQKRFSFRVARLDDRARNLLFEKWGSVCLGIFFRIKKCILLDR